MKKLYFMLTTILFVTSCAINPQYTVAPNKPMPTIEIPKAAEIEINLYALEYNSNGPLESKANSSKKSKGKGSHTSKPKKIKGKPKTITASLSKSKKQPSTLTAVKVPVVIPTKPNFTPEEMNNSEIVQTKLVDYIKVLRDELKKQQ